MIGTLLLVGIVECAGCCRGEGVRPRCEADNHRGGAGAMPVALQGLAQKSVTKLDQLAMLLAHAKGARTAKFHANLVFC